MNTKLLNKFCLVALLEGISYLFLLAIAMPLKYWADFPEVVTYTGWIHGILFVLYTGLLVFCAVQYNWKFGKSLLIFLAALLPVAPFFVERRLKKEMAQKCSATSPNEKG